MAASPVFHSMKARLASIVDVYAAAQGQIMEILSAVTPDNFSGAAAGSARRQIEEIVAAVNAAVHEWAGRSIAGAYDESAGIARMRLEIFGRKPLPSYKVKWQTQKKVALTRTVINDYAKANATILQLAGKYLAVVGYAAKKIAKIESFNAGQVRKMIDKTIAGALKETAIYNAGTAHLTSKQISGRVHSKLLERISGGDFISIKGKDGIVRDYNLKSYADLVARTRMREAQTEGTLDLCEQYDNDLVQFSHHDSPCSKCSQYEGKVYSISGKHPVYPKLPDEAYPPVHPHCEHNLNPTSETAIEMRRAA